MPERAEQDLRGVIAQLSKGETVTLIGTEGVPIALLVSLKLTPRENHKKADWDARWDALARQLPHAGAGSSDPSMRYCTRRHGNDLSQRSELSTCPQGLWRERLCLCIRLASVVQSG